MSCSKYLIYTQQPPPAEPLQLPQPPHLIENSALQSQRQPLEPSPPPQQAQAFSSISASLANPQSATSSPMPAPSQQQLPQYPPGVKVATATPAPDQSVPSGAAPQGPSTSAQRPTSTAPSQVPPQLQQQSRPTAFPGSLSDLVVSFENVKQKGLYYLRSVTKAVPIISKRLIPPLLQRHTACQILTRCTSCFREVTQTCRSHRIPRSTS